MDEEILGIDTEENLDLVVVDAEMLKTMVRTQGQILGHLQNLYSAVILLSSEYAELNEGIGIMADANKDLAKTFKQFVKVTKEIKCLASSVTQLTGKKTKTLE